MHKIYRNIHALLIVLAFCLMCASLPVQAEEYAPTVSVPETEIAVDQSSGQFCFTIEIDAAEAYAGAEFGVICSQGTEITSVTSTGGSVTGPQKRSGLVWFGFYDGADSFRGTTVVTVEGTCQIGAEGAVVVQDASLYTIGAQEYTTTDLECGTVVNLRSGPVETGPAPEDPADTAGGMDMNVLMPIGCLLVIAAAASGALIYNKKIRHTKTKKENDYASE